ncbi:MAG: acyltransferase [Burkholderiales bacterium]|nr:acyltransferase [Burkholderiales bacterium]
MKTQHIKFLDSIRGIAAVSVLIFHLYQIDGSERNIYSEFKLFAAGHEAVILFFVLSGFVLSNSINNSQTIFIYSKYIIKRLFRIMPVYYCSMLLAIVFYIIYSPKPISYLSDWFNNLLPSIKYLDYKLLISTIILAPSNKLNGVVWSLSYELVISVIFLPTLIVATQKYFKLSLTVMVTIAIIFLSFPPHKFINALLFYTVFFYLGLLMSIKRVAIKNIWFIPMFLLLYFNRFCLYQVVNYNEAIRDLMTALGSFGLISIIYYNNGVIKKILEFKLFTFYGNISYSLYLLHLPIMYICVYIFIQYIDIFYLKIMIFLFTSFFAFISYKYIECRFIQFGLYFSNCLITQSGKK